MVAEASVGRLPDLDRVLDRPKEQFPAGSRGAPVEAKPEFVEIILEIIRTNCTLIAVAVVAREVVFPQRVIADLQEGADAVGVLQRARDVEASGKRTREGASGR